MKDVSFHDTGVAMKNVPIGKPAEPQAFPVAPTWIEHEGRSLSFPGHPGMSLRDWFAGHFVSGVSFDVAQPKFFQSIAADAYLFADAMLKARESGGTESA